MNDLDIVRVKGTVIHQTPAGVKDESVELPPVFVDTKTKLGGKPVDIIYWNQTDQTHSENQTEDNDKEKES